MADNIVINTELALKIGLNESIMLKVILDRIVSLWGITALGEQIWIKSTIKDFQQDLPFWSLTTIQRNIWELKNKDILNIKPEPNTHHSNSYSVNFNILNEILKEKEII